MGVGCKRSKVATASGGRLPLCDSLDWGEVVTKGNRREPAVGSPPYLKAFFEVLTQIV